MDTKTQLENAVKDAMRAGDELRKRTLRMSLAVIRQQEIDKGTPVDETLRRDKASGAGGPGVGGRFALDDLS